MGSARGGLLAALKTWSPQHLEEFGVVEVTRMMEPNMDLKVVRDLIIKWDPEVRLRCFFYESKVDFRAGSFYVCPEIRF